MVRPSLHSISKDRQGLSRSVVGCGFILFLSGFTTRIKLRAIKSRAIHLPCTSRQSLHTAEDVGSIPPMTRDSGLSHTIARRTHPTRLESDHLAPTNLQTRLPPVVIESTWGKRSIPFLPRISARVKHYLCGVVPIVSISRRGANRSFGRQSTQ